MAHARRILFLSQWFEPEPTYKGLSFVRDLTERGFAVDVLTGFPNYPTGRLFSGYRLKPIARETMNGVRVTRVPLYPSHDAHGVRRSLNYLSFFLSATLYLLFRWRRYDAIYVYHPPITVGLAAALAGLIRRTPFVLEVQDLWPDGVAASGMANQRVVGLLGAACSFVYRRAAAIVAQSQGMADRIAQRGGGKKVTAVYNWAEEADTQPPGLTDLAPFGFQDHFTILYAGNMGPHQALNSVVRAAQDAAKRDARIRLVLVGGGICVEALRAQAAAEGGGAVRVMPGVPRTQVADLLAAADVLLVHLAALPMYAVTVPSKTQFYLAVGKPILAGVVGEAARLVSEAGAGIVVPPEDPLAMADAMVALANTGAADLTAMGEWGKRFYRENLSVEAGMDAIVAVIEQAIRLPRHPAPAPRDPAID